MAIRFQVAVRMNSIEEDLKLLLLTSQHLDYPLKLTYPLKIDGWKMKIPFKMVPFQGTFEFSGGTVALWFGKVG